MNEYLGLIYIRLSHHVQDSIETFSQQLEETRSELKAAVGRSVATHKKMSDTLTQRDQDMQKLQRQHTVDEARLEGLQQELAQKKSDILSLQERVNIA